MVGAGRIAQATMLKGGLVAFSDTHSPRFIQTPSTFLPSISCPIPGSLAGRVSAGSMVLQSGDGGGTGIQWSAGGTNCEMT